MWKQIDALLPSVSKPGRYVGGEWNSVVKNWQGVSLKLALAYPDVYEVGMSNMGIAILYDLLNRRQNVLAERVFTPWPDMEQAMRKDGIPLFSLETKTPLSAFDIVGFSLGYELTYTNVLNMLDLAAIPLHSDERDDSHPLIIAGGSCALNAEPMAGFFDLFVLGDGEDALGSLVDLYLAERERRGGERPLKQDFLEKAAQLPGIYVPALYEVTYDGYGTVGDVRPRFPGIPATVARNVVAALPPPVTRPIVPYLETIHDRAAVEIQRGCTRACRFCQAGTIYRPVRERPKEEVLAAIDAILHNTGHQEVSLVSLSSSDYGDIAGLVRELLARYGKSRLNVSLPSLRIDSFSVSLAEEIQRGKKTSFTFAPEAGTQRLRDVINKGVTEEDLLRSAETAFNLGWKAIKLYFMIGLPEETDEDVQGIVELVHKVRQLGKRLAGPRAAVRVSVATFVPKPHTPFQWVAQIAEEDLIRRLEILRRGLKAAGINLSWHDPAVSRLEATLSRGDRRLGKAIEAAWRQGCKFDAWSEHFDYEKWRRALDECGLDPAFYANRERSFEEVLPWSHLSSGVNAAYMRWEYKQAIEERSTPDCRLDLCNSCGLHKTIPACGEKQEGAIASLKERRASRATS